MESTLILVSFMIAIGLIGAVAIDVISVSQQAEAKGCENGLPHSFFGFNSSQGRCFAH